MRLINRHPGIPLRAALIALPFALLFVAYSLGSQARLAENPSDKLMPSPAKIVETAARLLTEPDRRSEKILFWYDT
ncbi:MAG: ABC transporter permease, partial [Pseudomonadota bacterium]